MGVLAFLLFLTSPFSPPQRSGERGRPRAATRRVFLDQQNSLAYPPYLMTSLAARSRALRTCSLVACLLACWVPTELQDFHHWGTWSSGMSEHTCVARGCCGDHHGRYMCVVLYMLQRQGAAPSPVAHVVLAAQAAYLSSRQLVLYNTIQYSSVLPSSSAPPPPRFFPLSFLLLLIQGEERGRVRRLASNMIANIARASLWNDLGELFSHGVCVVESISTRRGVRWCVGGCWVLSWCCCWKMSQGEGRSVGRSVGARSGGRQQSSSSPLLVGVHSGATQGATPPRPSRY